MQYPAFPSFYVCIPPLVNSGSLPSLAHNPQKYVQMSALDDKDVPSAEQWRDAVTFMTSALSRQIKRAEDDMHKLAGPTSFYDCWILWKSQSSGQVGTSSVLLMITYTLEPWEEVSSLWYYSGTSDGGHSEVWTSSLQWTNCLPLCLYTVLSITMESMLILNVSIIRRFHYSLI